MVTNQTKTCSGCHKNKPIDQFQQRLRNRDSKDGKCKSCTAAYNRNYYRTKQGRKEQILRHKARQVEINRQVVIEALQDGCVDCGESNIIVLDFDHVVGTKVEYVSTMVRGFSEKSLRKEIKKCEVVCANCHRIRTNRRRPTWKQAFV